MDFILYVLTAIIAYLGLLLGASVAHAVKDEIHTIRHHLFVFQLIAIILLFTAFFMYFPFFVVVSMLVLTFSFIWIFWNKKDVNMLDYIAFSLLFVISSLNLQAHFYATLIIFLFGFFAGAIYYVLHTIPKSAKKKKTAKTKKSSTKSVKKNLFNHPGVVVFAHKGRHYSFGEIVNGLFRKYVFFIPLTLIAYLLALVFTFLM